MSVIIPAQNAAAFIGTALASVCNQTYENLEIIVVDDGSDDETPDLVAAAAEKDSRITLLRQSNQGVAAARNRAIEASSGAFIAPLDADDVWFPRKIERQVACMLDGGESVGLVYAWWVSVSTEGGIVGASNRWEIEGKLFEALLYSNFIGNASVPLFRRSCLEAVGGYDETLKERGGEGCEDWALTLCIAERYGIRGVPAYLSGYRAVPGSMSKDCTAMWRSYELMMEAVERRHPELSPALLRWSRSNFILYLASLSYANGRFWRTLHWLREAVRADAAALISTWVVLTALKSAVRRAARPVTTFIWPDRRAWLHFKRRVLGEASPSFSLERLQEDPTSVSETWALKAWKPYDRLRDLRWTRIVEKSRGLGTPARVSSSDPSRLDWHAYRSS